eukprot:15365946-Ditylum_brightwellii.AAC.1
MNIFLVMGFNFFYTPDNSSLLYDGKKNNVDSDAVATSALADSNFQWKETTPTSIESAEEKGESDIFGNKVDKMEVPQEL